MNILQNENLIIESKNNGAELTRIYSKKLNRDILWHGDNKYWARRSPILFPIVGRLKNDQVIIEEENYSMGQHGFARDMDFEIESTSENSISYKLVSNEKTKKFYPYSFELIVKYSLLESSVKIDWDVVNTDSKDIFFSIGAHPAFNIDNSNLSDYYLKFNTRDNIEQIHLDGPFTSTKTSIPKLEKMHLNPEIFINDALIYTNIDEISIHNSNTNDIIKISFNKFPLVGIWTPYYKDTNSTAPFICIEPWYGVADEINASGKYSDKTYINKLSIGEVFKASYEISIG